MVSKVENYSGEVSSLWILSELGAHVPKTTALLFSHLHSVIQQLIRFKKRTAKKKKKAKKCWNFTIESFAVLVSMVMSSLLKTVGAIKIGAVSSKFCLVLRDLIFLVYL